MKTFYENNCIGRVLSTKRNYNTKPSETTELILQEVIMSSKDEFRTLLLLGSNGIISIIYTDSKRKKKTYKFQEYNVTTGEIIRTLKPTEVLDIYVYLKSCRLLSEECTRELILEFFMGISDVSQNTMKTVMQIRKNSLRLLKRVEEYLKTTKFMKSKGQKLVIQRVCDYLGKNKIKTFTYQVKLNLRALGYHYGTWFWDGTDGDFTFRKLLSNNEEVLKAIQHYYLSLKESYKEMILGDGVDRNAAADYIEANKDRLEKIVNSRDSLDSEELNSAVLQFYSDTGLYFRAYEGFNSGFRFCVTTDRLLNVNAAKPLNVEFVKFSSVITLHTLGELSAYSVEVSVYEKIIGVTVIEHYGENDAIVYVFDINLATNEIVTHYDELLHTCKNPQAIVFIEASLLSPDRVAAFICDVYEKFYTRVTTSKSEVIKTEEFSKPEKCEAPDEDITVSVSSADYRVSNVTLRDFVNDNPEMATKLITHKSHKSPITHIRRGHWSRSKLGKVFWVSETVVNEDKNDATEGYINYVIKE